MRRRTQLQGAVAAGAALSLIGSGVAFADYVTNDVTSTAAGKVLEVAAGGTATVVYGVQNQNTNAGDTQNNCNPADGTGVRITANGAPTGVTASQPVATACSTTAASMSFTVGSSVVPGNYSITHAFSDAGGGAYVDNAAFTLRVTAPADSTPPIITPTVTGTQGDNSWYTSGVGVSWSVTDAQSAISSRSGCDSVSITTDQAATTYTCSATSGGGTGSNAVTVKRDATAPTVTAGTPTGTAGSGTWYTSDVTVPFTASDGRSGLADPTKANFSVTSSGSGSAVSVASGTISDLAGNTASASATFAIDKTDPTISAALSPTAAATGWYNLATGAPTVSYTCTAGGSPIPAGACPTSHTFPEGENQTHSGSVTAASGRNATANVSDVDVDLVAPVISGSDVSNTTWRNTDLTQTFTASGGTSGLLNAGDDSFSLTASEESTATTPTTVSKTVTDGAGNSSTRTVTARIDKTAPTGVAVNGVNATEAFPHELPTGSCATTLADSLSGVASANTTPTQTRTATGVTYSCSATDVAGNVATETKDVAVKNYGFTSLLQPVDQGGVFNRVKAGSAIPVKFVLSSGTTSTEILDGAPVAKQIACPSTMLADVVEDLSAASVSGLVYEAGQHKYTWKTVSTQATKCYELTVLLKGGEKQTAKFHFTK